MVPLSVYLNGELREQGGVGYSGKTARRGDNSKQVLSRVQLFGTPRTVARQAPLSVGFSRQEYWSGLPVPSPGDLPNPGIFLTQESNLGLLHALPSVLPGKPTQNGHRILHETDVQGVEGNYNVTPV